jgi:hypothetical protein
MKVKAYKWENSAEVELTEISRVKKGYLVTGLSNWNEANVPFSSLTLVRVNVYEPGSRYHYEVSIIDKEHNTVSYKYAFSSHKRCNPQVVAYELINMYQ